MLNFSIPFARWPEILYRGCKSGTETKREVWLLRTGFGIASVNKLVSLTWLLWALRSFRSFTLHYTCWLVLSGIVCQFAWGRCGMKICPAWSAVRKTSNINIDGLDKCCNWFS